MLCNWRGSTADETASCWWRTSATRLSPFRLSGESTRAASWCWTQATPWLSSTQTSSSSRWSCLRVKPSSSRSRNKFGRYLNRNFTIEDSTHSQGGNTGSNDTMSRFVITKIIFHARLTRLSTSGTNIATCLRVEAPQSSRIEVVASRVNQIETKIPKMAVFEKNQLFCQRSRNTSRSFQTFSLISFLEHVPRQPWSTFHSELMVFIFYSRLALFFSTALNETSKVKAGYS